MKYVCGIDEAGRGPVIGPMVMALVAVEEKMEFEFKTIGVDDSKKLSPIRRRELAEIIRREGLVELEVISAQDIDEALRHPSRNLNILEAEVAGRLINKMVKRLGVGNIKQVVLDCPSINKEGYLTLMAKYVTSKVTLIAEHKADALYPVVSAASIIAKVLRDEEIEKLKKKHGVDFGSGYPGDATTASFVDKHFKEYDFFRTTWETHKRAVARSQQRSLGIFVEPANDPRESELVVGKKKKLRMLLEKGFTECETKGASEAYRIKGEGVTMTLYTNGRLLVQGREKERWKEFLEDR